MAITIRPFQENNEEFVIGLNKKNQEVLIPMDREELRFLHDKAEQFDVVYVDDVPAGYIIALREGIQEYDYKSYKWFCENYSKFLYIDQVVVDREYLNQGLGTYLYQTAFEHAKQIGVETVTAAITADNEVSLKFHERLGFKTVGEQIIRGGTTRIIQQVKHLSKEES